MIYLVMIVCWLISALTMAKSVGAITSTHILTSLGAALVI